MTRNWRPRGTKGPPIKNPRANENGDDFNGVLVKLQDGTEIGRLTNIRHVDRTNSMQKCYELNYGVSPLRAIMRDLIYLDLLEKANAQIFYNHHATNMTEDERRLFMEKYGVEVDPKKVDEAKKAQKPGEKTASVDDPNTNVPKDPDKGTEPFEKKPEDD